MASPQTTLHGISDKPVFRGQETFSPAVGTADRECGGGTIAFLVKGRQVSLQYEPQSPADNPDNGGVGRPIIHRISALCCCAAKDVNQSAYGSVEALVCMGSRKSSMRSSTYGKNGLCRNRISIVTGMVSTPFSPRGLVAPRLGARRYRSP